MKTLTGRANIAVAVCVILELILAEQARLDRGTPLGARHVGHHPGCLASLDVLDFEVAAVRHDRDCRDTQNFLRRRRGLRQQTHVDNLVGDLLLDDQLVLGIDRDLNVIAHANTGVRRHRPAVGVGEGDLLLSGLIQMHQHLLASRAPLADRGDLLGQVLDPRATCLALGGIALVQTLEVIVELGVGKFDELGQRCAGEVAVLVVDRLGEVSHPAAPSSRDRRARHRRLSPEPQYVPIWAAFSPWAPCAPSEISIAATPTPRVRPTEFVRRLRAAQTLNSFQEVGGRIARAACHLGCHTGEPRRGQIQSINKGFDKANRVLWADILVQRFCQEQGLGSVVTGDVAHAGFYPSYAVAGILLSGGFTRSVRFPHRRNRWGGEVGASRQSAQWPG
jgi:hypothetical protein